MGSIGQPNEKHLDTLFEANYQCEEHEFPNHINTGGLIVLFSFRFCLLISLYHLLIKLFINLLQLWILNLLQFFELVEWERSLILGRFEEELNAFFMNVFPVPLSPVLIFLEFRIILIHQHFEPTRGKLFSDFRLTILIGFSLKRSLLLVC